MQNVHSIKYGMYFIYIYKVPYKQIQCIKKLIYSIRIQFQLTHMLYIMKLISSPVKPPQLIFPSLILIKSSNTSILVRAVSDFSLWANFYMTLKNKFRDHILKIRFLCFIL